MQGFLNTLPPKPGTTGTVINEVVHGLEYLFPSRNGDGRWFAAYVSRLDDQVGVALTCWDRRFDSTLKVLYDPRYGDVCRKVYRPLWPTFFRLLDNAVNKQFPDGAIGSGVDADDEQRKYFVALTFALTSVKDDGTNRIFDTYVSRVVSLSNQVSAELIRKPSRSQKVMVALHAGMSGYHEVAEYTEPVSRVLDWLRLATGQ